MILNWGIKGGFTKGVKNCLAALKQKSIRLGLDVDALVGLFRLHKLSYLTGDRQDRTGERQICLVFSDERKM